MRRIRPLPEVVEQDTRQRLLALVGACPGVSLSAAARALGVDYSTVQYHVRVLETYRQIECASEGRPLRLQLRARSGALDEAGSGRGEGAPRGDVLDVVRARGACTLQDVVVALDVPRSTARARLARLAGEGVLAVEKRDGAFVYRFSGFGG